VLRALFSDRKALILSHSTEQSAAFTDRPKSGRGSHYRNGSFGASCTSVQYGPIVHKQTVRVPWCKVGRGGRVFFPPKMILGRDTRRWRRMEAHSLQPVKKGKRCSSIKSRNLERKIDRDNRWIYSNFMKRDNNEQKLCMERHARAEFHKWISWKSSHQYNNMITIANMW
jgi:hypothetical protein